jgi:hypothetical protein
MNFFNGMKVIYILLTLINTGIKTNGIILAL